MMRNKPEINFLISLIIFVIIEIMILGTDHIIGIVVVTRDYLPKACIKQNEIA